VTGGRVTPDVGVDAVQRADGFRREHVFGRTLRDDAAGAQEDQVTAQRGGKVEIVCRQHHRDAAFTIQSRQQQLHVELVAEIERSRRLVQQQQFGALRQRAGDDDPLLLAAAQRREWPVLEGRGAG
jgi:hypothetical protein